MLLIINHRPSKRNFVSVFAYCIIVAQLINWLPQFHRNIDLYVRISKFLFCLKMLLLTAQYIVVGSQLFRLL